MTFLYPNPVLQMKHSFWRIIFDVICRSGYRTGLGINFVCRYETFWLTESDWCFKKVFHTVFDVLVTHKVFLSLTVFAFEGKENALLFCHNCHFFPSSYNICDQFLWTCPQKNICIANWLLLLKKRFKN